MLATLDRVPFQGYQLGWNWKWFRLSNKMSTKKWVKVEKLELLKLIYGKKSGNTLFVFSV